MKTLPSDKVVMVDCDDTLVLWDSSKWSPFLHGVQVNCYGYSTSLHIHEKNINLLRKLKRLGYTLVVWSATGHEWAEAVVKALDLEDCVSFCMSKPRYYVDDKDAVDWIGARLWRDPVTGDE